ncbi:Uu.00g057710.m01.CDS01 [Anthostomella pinea]|uniref:Uu.00g057710.m01.CDS01 n=1 Tax=Anthostomella pinea TaxID=933095 RepID=A0AAI8YJS9_9PEZI|nr:Uu.00g057710.m01.CDS01 [Anthostomella pinea]
MDAQNVVESSNTKQPASPRRGDTESGLPTSRPTASPAANIVKSPITSKPTLSAPKDPKPPATSSNAQEDDAAPDQNSDAETIVLPGKDGISPLKPRKVIKHEDRSEGEIDDVLPPPRKPLRDSRDGDRNGVHSADTVAAASLLGKKTRPFEKEKQQRGKDGSSGLSSAPASPPGHRRNNHDSSHPRHRPDDAHSESDSESSKSRSHKLPQKDKSKPVDRHVSAKRKPLKTESDDEGESRKARRPRISDTTLDASAARERDHRQPPLRQPDRQSTSRNRSLSPHGRAHRRSLSTQLPSQTSNGLSTKKRRIPAPLHTTDYQSDDSSASGSPHPRSSKLRSIATPLTGDSTMSPAKLPAHKKHVDNHGQTWLAKACARGEYETAKKRLAERPEDLNFADYAGNTPLQVAALHGHEGIVQLLVDAGCNLDCRNGDKETPLLDAVENGHLGVIKILLKAGVNPRKADASGHEPLEKVPDDVDNADEIRAALREAKERVGELRRTSEDHQPQDSHDALSSHGADSPRRSPAASASSILAAQRRGGTVRSTKTSNHLLYMNLDDKTLRQAAARGDNETVTRVLQVKERCDDPEALVNAARGGHKLVVELLLALGGANPDPRPVANLPVEFGTPMLAAIGQENLDVVKLLVNANGFDPTRRYKGQTYYEIARRREGPNWKDEEHILKIAYDERKKSKGSSKPKSSPNRREQDLEPGSKRAQSSKRRPLSPSREADAKKRPATKVPNSPKQKRRSLSFSAHDEQTSPKRGPGRPKREERAANTGSSDPEASPAASKPPAKSRMPESEGAAGSSDGEAVKPRRKLISGKERQREKQEKQRRASMASNNSTDRVDTKNDDAPEKTRPDRLSEKYHDRTKALKRDDSIDKPSGGDNSSKRSRSSVSPSRHGSGDKDDVEAPVKRRKLVDSDGRERRQSQLNVPDDRQRKRNSSRESAKRQRPSENERKEPEKVKKIIKSHSSDKNSITVASEPDVEMRDAPPAVSSEDSQRQAERERQEAKKRQAEAEAAAAAAAVEDAKGKETERQRQEEERKKQEAEAKRKEQEAEQKRLEEEERARLEREELKRKQEAEKARLEEERKLREEEEKRQREEEKRQQEEEEQRRKEEEERKQREEEDRIRREKEAAEEVRRLREEEERRERERKRAERAARELELMRARQEEQERLRLSKLPPLLRWLDGCQDSKQKEVVELFAKAQGVRYDTIRPSATGLPDGREQWLLNTQVALLLGEKDLTLSRYTAWEHIPVSRIAKRVIWRLEQDRYALTEGRLYHLGDQLSDYYGGDPHTVGYKRLEQLRGLAAERFFETDMFFVKESDFLYIVPTIPHLRNVKLSICYRELPEHESALLTWSAPAKWKQDPGAESRGSFAPRYKHYINGQLVGEDKPQPYKPSREPFAENRVPRRGGLIAVSPDEPDYARLCIEQNLAHLLTEQQKQSVLNGAHLTPRSMASNDHTGYAGGDLSPTSISPRTIQVNGVRSAQGSPEKLLPNGLNGNHSDENH